MITEDQLQLITAAVDCELSDREVARLEHLLETSEEARGIHDGLKADRDRLRNLPLVPHPLDLHAHVMAAIVSLPPLPARRLEPARRSWADGARQLAPMAVAASLLIGISSLSFWFFTRSSDAGNMARNQDLPQNQPRPGGGDRLHVKGLPPDASALPAAPMPSPGRDKPIQQEGPAAVPFADTVATAPEPRVSNRDLFGAHPSVELPHFDLVDLRLPFLKSLADFDRDDVRSQLIEELGQDPAFRIDLFSRNLGRGVELFQTAARLSGVVVHADASTLNHLKKGHVGAVAVYVDTLTAPQLTALFKRLSAEDAKVSPHVFDMLHAVPVGREDEIELRRVLGVDPGLFKRTLPERERGVKDVEKGKALSTGTADQIVKSITAGQGKSGGNGAVLLTWSPPGARTPPAVSAELKSYLAKRGDRKTDAVPVIILIRHGNG